MTSTNNFKNIDEVLNILNQINTANSSEVYVPSLKKSIKFKPLTEKHQTAIINVYNISPILDNDFNILFSNILKELVAEPLDIMNLNVIDKYCIAVQLKVNNQGATYMDFDTKEEYDVMPLVNSYKSNDFFIPEDMTFSLDEFEVTIGLPSYKNEIEFDNLLSQKIQKLDLTDEKAYRALLSEILFYMLLQYIKSIKIDGKFDISNFSDLNGAQKKKIGEVIPSKVFDRITHIIDEDFAPYIQKCLELNENTTISYSPKLFLKLDK